MRNAAAAAHKPRERRFQPGNARFHAYVHNRLIRVIRVLHYTYKPLRAHNERIGVERYDISGMRHAAPYRGKRARVPLQKFVQLQNCAALAFPSLGAQAYEKFLFLPQFSESRGNVRLGRRIAFRPIEQKTVRKTAAAVCLRRRFQTFERVRHLVCVCNKAAAYYCSMRSGGSIYRHFGHYARTRRPADYIIGQGIKRGQ